MKRFQNLTFLLLLLFSCTGMAEDSRVQQPEGFQQIEFVSAAKSVTPGETFQVGLIFTLAPEYHTYWRGPGVVGVAPIFEWDLPEGFQVGKTYSAVPTPPPIDLKIAFVVVFSYFSMAYSAQFEPNTAGPGHPHSRASALSVVVSHEIQATCPEQSQHYWLIF